MAEKFVPVQSTATQHSLLVPGATKKPQKQQQKGHQQSSEFSQQKGRADPKVTAGSNQSSRPSAAGNAGQNNRQLDHPKSDSKQQVTPASAPRTQQTQRTVPKVSIRLSLFDHLPRKQVNANPHSIEGDISLHPATVKLGKNSFFTTYLGKHSRHFSVFMFKRRFLWQVYFTEMDLCNQMMIES